MSGKVYSWKDGAAIKADAQKVGERLEWLETRHNGLLSAEAVLADAKDEASPLNAAFEWDDTEAAQQYRLDQARSLMRSIKVEIRQVKTVPAVPVRAYVNVRQHEQRGYAPIATAMSDADLRQQILQRAFRELKHWHDRYKEYEELAAVFAAIEQTADKISA